MRIKLGPDKGNPGAIIRWGKHLDSGIWLRTWRFRRLWTSFRFMRGYVSLGVACFRW